MKTNFDRRKSVQELERDDWGEPDYDSHLVQTCHRLRRIPLAEFTTEDLRIMIGQKIGLRFLVPLALEKLNECPMGDHGDLLNAILNVPEEFWSQHPDMRDGIRQIDARVKRMLSKLNPDEG